MSIHLYTDERDTVPEPRTLNPSIEVLLPALAGAGEAAPSVPLSQQRLEAPSGCEVCHCHLLE